MSSGDSDGFSAAYDANYADVLRLCAASHPAVEPPDAWRE
jgi:hypothetical protein